MTYLLLLFAVPLIANLILTCSRESASTVKTSTFQRGAYYFNIHAITSNTLCALRDAIKCPKDFEVPGDFGFNPDAVSSTRKARDIFPSSMFFIEDNFYVDNRYVKTQDYSK